MIFVQHGLATGKVDLFELRLRYFLQHVLHVKVFKFEISHQFGPTAAEIGAAHTASEVAGVVVSEIKIAYAISLRGITAVVFAIGCYTMLLVVPTLAASLGVEAL
jgi:hypothetical protein